VRSIHILFFLSFFTGRAWAAPSRSAFFPYFFLQKKSIFSLFFFAKKKKNGAFFFPAKLAGKKGAGKEKKSFQSGTPGGEYSTKKTKDSYKKIFFFSKKKTLVFSLL
jgi:hypothetical protein